MVYDFLIEIIVLRQEVMLRRLRKRFQLVGGLENNRYYTCNTFYEDTSAVTWP